MTSAQYSRYYKSRLSQSILPYYYFYSIYVTDRPKIEFGWYEGYNRCTAVYKFGHLGNYVHARNFPKDKSLNYIYDYSYTRNFLEEFSRVWM